MKKLFIPKILVLSVMGIFLLATSCTAKKQSEETAGNASQNTTDAPQEQKPMSQDQTSTNQNKPTSAAAMPAPDFSLMTINNKKISLTDFLGNKIILINFWATWCPYCVAEIPHLNKIETSLADQVKLLSIDILEKPEKVKSFAQQKGVKFDVLLDQQGEVARKYRIRGTPTSIVIDKTGNMSYVGYELAKAEEAIMNLLQK